VVRTASVIVFVLMVSLLRLNGAEFYNDWATNRLSSVSSQSSPTNDPDGDGISNLAEYTFGTDPLVSDGGSSMFVRDSGSNGMYRVEFFELAGHRQGVQIDVDATVDMTHWIRPWWLRQLTNSLPGDPVGSVREVFTTWLPGANTFIVRGVIKLIEAGPETAMYYVATNGNDSAAGTSTNAPFATLSKAASVATPGALIYVRGGTYMLTQRVLLPNKGATPSQPIRVRAYPGEQPVFNCFNQPLQTNGIVISGSCWRLYGFEIAGAGQNGINISGHSNRVERCVIHDSRDSGLHFGSSSSTNNPSHNLILNCDSYRNYDADEHGQDADGFGAKFNIGPGNVFRGCRAWENSDDGWDLWMATSTVLIENCWTWRNGSNFWNDVAWQGNGNGFKLGGNYVTTPHRIANCISFDNTVRGYDQNNNMGTLTVDSNTAWNNATNNFQLEHPSTSTPHIVRNNLAIGTATNRVRAGSVLLSNSWQIAFSPALGSNDVLSLDDSWAAAPRRDDGGLPETPFLRPVPGGRLLDKGYDIGQPFAGPAPELGAFESLVW
jgi:hypothetical protein